MYKSTWMAVGEVLPCKREVNNYIIQTIFVFVIMLDVYSEVAAALDGAYNYL